jgi:riboflavin kinase/FMN adenylyltransferase
MCDAARRRLAVGFFDGVHLGHREILAGADAALTFNRHPLSVITPQRAPKLLMSFEERMSAIRGCGVEAVTALDFTGELASMTAERFAAEYLAGNTVRCGADWRFGAGGEGDVEWLRRNGYDVETVEFGNYGGERISSSRIRSALRDGDVASAAAMLGRRYSLSGTVSRGKGLGSEIGFPTVNVLLPEDRSSQLPRSGVYEVSSGGVRGVANYGVAPSMGERAWPHPVLEINFPGAVMEFPEGSRLTAEFVRFIRPELKFDSLGELQRQIARDIASLQLN